jgi:hypothetical protein
MSPYPATSFEVILRYGVSRERIDILKGWLSHRSALRAIGFRQGFQWLDGSFLEDKTPKDLDVVSFVYMGAPSFENIEAAWHARTSNIQIFDRGTVKAAFHVDLFSVDLLDSPELLVGATRYFFGLFSHQRSTLIWKGMLQVRLEDDGSDESASEMLQALEVALQASDSATSLLAEQEGLPDAT